MVSHYVTPKTLPQSNVMLLSLPAELRIAIYQYALFVPEPIHFRLDRSPVVEPGLLAVNRQIRNEAISIFYGQNTFYASMNGVVEMALRTIAEDKLPLFNTIHAFSIWGLRLTPPDAWYTFVRRRAPVLWDQHARALVKKSALLVPLRGWDGVIWTTIDELGDYVLVQEESYAYFTKERKTERLLLNGG